ncbi:cell surface protein [Myriangium duriaei CBS 260.36]|uniref:Cell surface protein n=1 Tax=Myriangium duriaei CBS 260.36 TaxID=1168546 RepID=A0A9P4MFZ4_9PEZI|nr:cell surface protein [Myriangium duriaei CBS 260.36]
MLFNAALIALAASPLVAAHGKIAVVTGDAGGNGTALGIKGGIVPGPGSNSVTEVDTTVFGNTNIATNGLGRTTGSGRNTVSMMAEAMALSGNTLPQVSADGGSISGTFHIVTTDGAGPVKAMIDSTGTGAFANGQPGQILTQVPGNGGNISPSGKVPGQNNRRGLVKRAANVNKDYPVKVAIPAGTKCTGTVGSQSNVCLLKIANANAAGPFGGVVAFQIADKAAAPAAAATGATGTTGTSPAAGTLPANACVCTCIPSAAAPAASST